MKLVPSRNGAAAVVAAAIAAVAAAAGIESPGGNAVSSKITQGDQSTLTGKAIGSLNLGAPIALTDFIDCFLSPGILHLFRCIPRLVNKSSNK